MAACQNSVVLTARPPRIRDSWQEPGLPMPCRPVLDFHRFYVPIHADGSPYSNSAPIHSRSLHTHPQSPCIPIPPCWLHASRDRRGIAVGPHRRPPYASVALRQFTKNCKVRNPTSRRPYTVAHVSQIPMRLGSTYGPSPHTFYADPTYCPQAPKISTLVSIRPAFPAPQIPKQSGPTNSPTLGYTCTAMTGTAQYARARKPTRQDQRPAYADPRIQPTHTNSLRRRGGHGRRRRHGAAACHCPA